MKEARITISPNSGLSYRVGLVADGKEIAYLDCAKFRLVGSIVQSWVIMGLVSPLCRRTATPVPVRK